jgi:hypothetical protein
MRIEASLVLAAMFGAVACGGSKPAATATDAPAAGAATGATAPAAAGTASSSSPTPTASPTSAPAPTVVTPATANPGSAPAASSAPPPPAPPAHPFAHNAEEATSLIDDAIATKTNEVVACVDAARTRRKDAHAKIVVTVGIDELGHLIGIELPKGEKKDKALVDCMLDALRTAPFPTSHAGVITVKKTFEDKAVYR